MNIIEQGQGEKQDAMLPDERRYAIVKELVQRDNGTASVAALAERFAVSEMTIRRDLAWLEARALVQRIHGGAMVHNDRELEKPFADRSTEQREQKRAIGALAAPLVEDGDRIILDAGTTTREVARHLLSRRDLTVITNALPVAEELASMSQITVMVLGGMLKHDELCTVGPAVTRELARLSADKVFLSAAGFDLERGVTDPDTLEADVKEAMIRAANQVFLVADSSKWRHVALARITWLNHVDALITDDRLEAEARSAIEALGVQIVTPSTPLLR